MPPDSTDPDPPAGEGTDDEAEAVGRRGFFTEGFRHMMKPLANLVEQRLQHLSDVADETERASNPSPPSYSSEHRYTSYPSGEPGSQIFLRPPGALPEEDFLQTCTASGRCIESCPVAAIKPAWSDDPLKDRRPVIEARSQACVVCQDLSCMSACPSGALQPMSANAIRMGEAIVSESTCVRSEGEDCQICVDKCPLGPLAIDIPDLGGEVVVHTDGCVGCGVCEMYCPTDPKAIVIEPTESIEDGD